MKLKTKPSQLEQVERVLKRCGIEYGRAVVKARDEHENKEIETIVVMGSFVFAKATGQYLFSGPISNPSLPGPNHKPT